MIHILFWVFVACASIQFLFYSLVAIALLAYKRKSDPKANPSGISVIISSKNELENLKVLIPKLMKQNHPEYEVILVDDRSTDETYDHYIDLDHQQNNFKLVRIDSTPDHINNKKYALTLGIRAARYDYVLLTDADCNPESNNWVQEMSLGFDTDKKNFVIGFSQYLEAPGLLNLFIRYETLLTAISYVGLGLLGRPYMAVGRNFAYKKSFFLDNKGFGKFQNVVGGDDDLLANQHARSRNTTIVLSADATVYSKPETSWGNFLRQKTRHLSVGKHYRFTDKLLLGLLTLSKILFWFCFIAVIMSVFETYLVLACFFIVMVSLLSSLLLLGKKTGSKSSIWMLPILDFIYLFYYISTSLRVLFTKKVKWK